MAVAVPVAKFTPHALDAEPTSEEDDQYSLDTAVKTELIAGELCATSTNRDQLAERG